jgi:2-polyprenyl-6-methoxyphenol hydroxylase-like FAD-dependent oxidoreductase
MPDVVIAGAGVVGLAAALLLAKDCHRVTVLERDRAAPPETPDAAWTGWQRRGISQFRQLHYFQPRFRVIVEDELPEVAEALDRAGALRFNPVLAAPAALAAGTCPGDEAFTVLTARRPVIESVLAQVTADTPGIAVRRGTAVTCLLTGATAARGVCHITGIGLQDGTQLRADLVVDATGRRSRLPALLQAIGAPAPVEEREDCGFVYYARHFRDPAGSIPEMLGLNLQDYGSISSLTLPADNGTWGVGLITSARDKAARALKDTACWTRVLRSLPLVAHWTDGEPLDERIVVMAGIEDRHRSFTRAGRPIATGLVAVGDAWACTNPSIGRGASIGLLHALALRDLLRTSAIEDPPTFTRRWEAITRETVEPWYRATLRYDRHRLAEIEAAMNGTPYEPADPAWATAKALAHGASADGGLLRARLRIAGVLTTPGELMAEPGLADRIKHAGSDWRDHPLPGPGRKQLLQLLSS